MGEVLYGYRRRKAAILFSGGSADRTPRDPSAAYVTIMCLSGYRSAIPALSQLSYSPISVVPRVLRTNG